MTILFVSFRYLRWSESLEVMIWLVCNTVSSRDVYHYQNSIRFILLIHCFNTRYVSSILISSKCQDRQVRVLLTVPSNLCFNVRMTLWRSCQVQNCTQCQSGVKWVFLFCQKIVNSSLFPINLSAQKENDTISFLCFDDFNYRIVGKYRCVWCLINRYISLLSSQYTFGLDRY